jgi:hypothetical protein
MRSIIPHRFEACAHDSERERERERERGGRPQKSKVNFCTKCSRQKCISKKSHFHLLWKMEGLCVITFTFSYYYYYYYYYYYLA